MLDMQKRSTAEISKMLTEQADQLAAGSVMAENAAKAKAEKIISQGSDWAARKITEAGEKATAAMLAEREKAEAALDRVAQWVRWAVIAAAICSTAAAAAAVSTLVLVWPR